MSQRISIKLTNENDWIIDEIEKARIVHNRSRSNYVETVLIEHFAREQEKKKNSKKS